MEGIGVVLLAFAGWLGYCAVHSFRPLRMLSAIVKDPSNAATTIKQAEADAATSANTASDVNGGGFSIGPASTTTSKINTTNVSGEQAYANARGQEIWGSAWNQQQMAALVELWNMESGWNPNAYNSGSGATGIPQALPGDKMASAGADWKSNPKTQINWGLDYIKQRYGTPEAALNHELSNNPHWY